MMFPGWMLGILFGSFFAVGMVEWDYYSLQKNAWTCTQQSQPKEIGEKVECVQYTRRAKP